MSDQLSSHLTSRRIDCDASLREAEIVLDAYPNERYRGDGQEILFTVDNASSDGQRIKETDQ